MQINDQYNTLNSLSNFTLTDYQKQVQKDTFFSHLHSRNLSDLLPSIDAKNTKKALIEYSLLLSALSLVIKFVKNRDLKKFDALVSDHHCEIRALIIQLHLNDCLPKLLIIKDNVNVNLEKVLKLINSPSLNNKADFKLLLKNEDLEISLSGIEVLFVELFLLTVVKGEDNKTAHIKLQEIVKVNANEISSHFRDKLVKNSRDEVSAISAPFLMSLVNIWEDTKSGEMLSQNYIIPINNRKCVPMFWTTKVVFHATFLYGIPIVIWVKEKNHEGTRVKEFCTYYERDPLTASYSKKNPLHINMHKPVIVVETLRTRKERSDRREFFPSDMKKMDPLHFLLAHAADHCQYPDKAMDVHVENTSDESYHFYKKKAIEWKCDRNDPSIPHIHHIYSNILGNIEPIKYEIDSYLEAMYGDFYRHVESAKLNELAKQLNIDIKVEVVNKKLFIKFSEKNLDLISLELGAFGERKYRPFLHQLSQRIYEINENSPSNLCDTLITSELKTDWRDFFNPLSLSGYHDNPIKFLIDHRSMWEHSKFDLFKKVAIFISENPENFKKPDVLDMFFDWVHIAKFRNSYRLMIIFECISQALLVPECRDRVKDFLIDIGTITGNSEKDTDAYYISRRSMARKGLKKLREENETREILHEMLASENLIPLKINLLVMLEGFNEKFEQKSRTIENLLTAINAKSLNSPYIDLKKVLLEILEFIINEGSNKELKISAIRCLFNFFFNLPQEFNSEEVCDLGNAVDHSYELSIQQSSRLIIFRFLKYLIQDETVDVDIKSEASSILNRITEYLNKINFNLEDQTLFEINYNSWSRCGIGPSSIDWVYFVLGELKIYS